MGWKVSSNIDPDANRFVVYDSSYDPEKLSRITEKRVVDADTGGEKGSKPSQLSFIDPLALVELGNVAGFGTEKYDKWNYMKGYDWSLSMNAMQRHINAFWGGELVDPESGYNHMAHAAWHALALISFSERELGTDDRYKS